MVLIDDLWRYQYWNTEYPSRLYRTGSYSVLLGIHAICRTALKVFNNTEVHGGERFLELVKGRADYKKRKRGLITVSNHISVLDDPVIWGALPLSFAAFYGGMNHRWSFASHDLCFNNTPLSHFFTLGQCFPTHRIKHSKHGGLFQPTFTEAVRILSEIPDQKFSWNPHCVTIPGYPDFAAFASSAPKTTLEVSWPKNAVDPFSWIVPRPAFPSQPNDVRVYNAPSRYAANSYSWVHIFPEGFVHQTDPDKRYMRYFKWGVSRLILEPPECPDIVPMFIEGTDQIMHESRTFPRFIPRLGKKVVITFGGELDIEAKFGDLRRRWREICDRENEQIVKSYEDNAPPEDPNSAVSPEKKAKMRKEFVDFLYGHQLGYISEKLKYDPEVVELRKECTNRVREEVLKLRRARGYPDEDPKAGIAETWKLEGPKREGKMEDDSWVKET